jgi:hypothetical protein
MPVSIAQRGEYDRFRAMAREEGRPRLQNHGHLAMNQIATGGPTLGAEFKIESTNTSRQPLSWLPKVRIVDQAATPS